MEKKKKKTLQNYKTVFYATNKKNVVKALIYKALIYYSYIIYEELAPVNVLKDNNGMKEAIENPKRFVSDNCYIYKQKQETYERDGRKG